MPVTHGRSPKATRRLTAVISATVAATVVLAVKAAAPPRGSNVSTPEGTRAAAQRLESKFRVLQTPNARPASSYPPVIITENEANAYLQVHGRDFLPAGVHNPGVRMEPEHVTGFAAVNFEEFSRIYSNPNDWGPKVLAAMFKGTQQVIATGKVQSDNGQARVEIESVKVGSMKVPGWLVDFVVQNYLQPRYKFDLGKPIPLPQHVSQIVIGTGQTIFLRNPVKGH